MQPEDREKGAASAKTAPPNKTLNTRESYRKRPEMSSKRAEMVAERRAQMPRAYRANYDKAVKGRSLRACVNAQCLECVCWQKMEVRLCTDLACPLYTVRPYQNSDVSQNGQIGGFMSAESPKGEEGGNHAV